MVLHIPWRADPVLGLLGLVAVAPPLAAQRPDTARAAAAAPVASAATARADTAGAPDAPYRDPRRARVLGTVLPGAGHVYAGEYVRGYLLGASTLGLLALGPAIYRLGTVNDLPRCAPPSGQLVCRDGARSPYHAAGVLTVAAGAAAWVWGALDAPHAAERANARRRRARAALLIAPPPGSRGEAAIGVAVRSQ